MIVWLTAGAVAIALWIALDRWVDSRPGGRRYDADLAHLRAQENYRAALRRIHELNRETNK